MKKVINILIALGLMTLVMPMALADEAAEITEQDVQIMESPYGAEIRFLQLEKSISKNIYKGEYVISILNESYYGQENSTQGNSNETGSNETGYNVTIPNDYNLSKLMAIVAEMKLLREEVQDVNSSSSNVTEVFFDLKSDAIELTKEFRYELHELLLEETLDSLKLQVGEMVSEQFKNLDETIQNRIKQYNRVQLNKVFDLLGEKNTSNLSKYENGSMTIDTVKSQIAQKLNEMTQEKRGEVFSSIKEEQIRKRIQAKVNIEKAQENFQQRKEVRLTNRLQNIQGYENGSQIQNELEKQIEQRIQNMNEQGGKGDS